MDNESQTQYACGLVAFTTGEESSCLGLSAFRESL